MGYDPGELIGKPLIGTLIPKKDLEGQSMKRYLGTVAQESVCPPLQ